jgi:hypothetical protein
MVYMKIEITTINEKFIGIWKNPTIKHSAKILCGEAPATKIPDIRKRRRKMKEE